MRSVVPFVSLGVLLAAVVLEFLFPQYSTIIFFVLLAWVIISFTYFLSPAARRRPSPAGMGTSSRGPPNLTGLSPDIGFCIYCAAPLEPGTTTCPSCGRSLPLT
ncbi:MAG: hypothetical protein L3K17_01090 [Thermoplasmata archaeon]|nr:hypothetical protein [Thermoplasmata archaeon]